MYLNLRPMAYRAAVLRTHPDATCRRCEKTMFYRVYPTPQSHCPLGYGDTPRLAWKDAFTNIERRENARVS